MHATALTAKPSIDSRHGICQTIKGQLTEHGAAGVELNRPGRIRIGSYFRQIDSGVIAGRCIR
jgi:hypothetical protein